MFIRKQVVVFFILQNFVSSLCGTVQVDVDPECEGSDSEHVIVLDYPGEDYDDDTNFLKRMALVAGARISNEDSENNFKEYSGRFSILSLDGSNENTDEISDYNEYESSEPNIDKNSEYNENESSQPNIDENSEYNENESSEPNMDENSEYNENESSEPNMDENSEYNENESSEPNMDENSENNENESSEPNMDENSEYNENESSESNMNENSEYNENESSEPNMDENSENNENESSEPNMDENSENNVNENTEANTENSEYNVNESSEEKNDKTLDNNVTETPDSENNSKLICPGEDHSMISRNDIKYLIQEKAESLKIMENILNSYYPDAAEVLKKNLGDIEDFKKRFKERPEHLRYVLHSITSLRQGLEPNIKEIADQLEQFHALEDDFNDVAKGSVVTLKQLEKYKTICKINCEEISTENRFGNEIINNSLIFSNRTDMHCIRLKDLNDYIDKKLKQAQYGEGLYQPLEGIDKLYEQKISDLKNNLKKAGVKQFGNTMYDILSLHDDYHYFMKDLEHVNISSEIYNIIENIAEIGFVRVGLKRDIEKYRQYCMKCGSQRVKRNVLEGVGDFSVELVEKINDTETGADFSVNAVVDELILAEIDEIKEGIQSNFTTMFAALDEIVNDPNVVDTYVKDLHSIQGDIEEGIKAEQEAFHILRSRVSQESIDKVTALSKESSQMVQNLESAKLYIAQFIQ